MPIGDGGLNQQIIQTLGTAANTSGSVVYTQQTNPHTHIWSQAGTSYPPFTHGGIIGGPSDHLIQMIHEALQGFLEPGESLAAAFSRLMDEYDQLKQMMADLARTFENECSEALPL